MRHTGYPHAAVLWPNIGRVSSRFVRYTLQIMPPVSDTSSSWVLYDYDDEEAEFEQRTGVRPFLHDSLRQNLRPDETQKFFTMLYTDSVIVVSDTLVLEWGPLTTVKKAAVPSMPNEFVLHPNYPNPFNPSTLLRFTLDRRASVKLLISNIRGQIVLQKQFGELSRGEHQYQWDSEQHPTGVTSSGVYIARFFLDSKPAASQKMVLMR